MEGILCVIKSIYEWGRINIFPVNWMQFGSLNIDGGAFPSTYVVKQQESRGMF